MKLLGEFYAGEYLNDMKHGKGTIKQFFGVILLIVARNTNTQGTYTFSNGCIYEGEWSQGLFNGMGTLRHPSTGEEYIGAWYALYCT